jgi:hypothetical protein
MNKKMTLMMPVEVGIYFDTFDSKFRVGRITTPSHEAANKAFEDYQLAEAILKKYGTMYEVAGGGEIVGGEHDGKQTIYLYNSLSEKSITVIVNIVDGIYVLEEVNL